MTCLKHFVLTLFSDSSLFTASYGQKTYYLQSFLETRIKKMTLMFVLLMLQARQNMRKMFSSVELMKILSSMGGEYMIMFLVTTSKQHYVMKRRGRTVTGLGLYTPKMYCHHNQLNRMETMIELQKLVTPLQCLQWHIWALKIRRICGA